MSTDSLNIANQSRTLFRAAVNAALQALAGKMSAASGSDPSTTYAYQDRADTTNAVLKRRNAANSGWIDRDTLDEAFVIGRSSNTILGRSDRGKAIVATAGFTQTLTAAATLGDGWSVHLRVETGATVVIDPNGAETIDGAATKSVTGPASGMIFCDGAGFYTTGFLAAATGGGFLAPTAAVNANALTVTIPSGATLNFNDGTSVTLSGSISMTVSSGSTLGTVSGQYSTIWIAALKNSGTPEVAVRNNWHDANASLLGFDTGNTISTTAEGGAGAADSAQVWYSTTSRASQPWAIVGVVVSSQATAGTWATAPLFTRGYGPGMPLPGAVLQTELDTDASTSTLSTAIPRDDTKPQNTEGTQVFSTSLTAFSPANLLRAVADINLGTNGGSVAVVVATFIDTGADAVQVAAALGYNSDSPVTVHSEYSRVFNTASAVAVKQRAGCHTGTDAFLNGNASGRIYGGAMVSRHTLREVQT